MEVGAEGVDEVAETTPAAFDDSVAMASIVVPTYNEAENIPVLLEALHDVLSGSRFEIVVVDDNSPDET